MFRSSQKEEIEKEVKRVVALIFDTDESELSGDTRYVEDLFAKSVQILEFIATLESSFNIDIELKEARENKTIDETIEYIIEKLKEKE